MGNVLKEREEICITNAEQRINVTEVGSEWEDFGYQTIFFDCTLFEELIPSTTNLKQHKCIAVEKTNIQRQNTVNRKKCPAFSHVYDTSPITFMAFCNLSTLSRHTSLLALKPCKIERKYGVYLRQQSQPLLENVVDTTVTREIFFCFETFLAMTSKYYFVNVRKKSCGCLMFFAVTKILTHTQQMSLINV